ncbi:MAG: hypothetical protein LBT04_07375 [Prevotellaceae bacterium]|jgi:hypothetical protein|nr:hypothetical protein [Prevotellaceae bacterium]
MQKLDGRSWNIEKLERTLNITNLESYLNFIKQISAKNTFSNEINPIRSYVLDVFFRKIKKYRQVIIVSHNANLVVNADSEQIVIARNEEGVLKYISGSLENPEINKQICKILEGGERAFLNREKKYGFKK